MVITILSGIGLIAFPLITDRFFIDLDVYRRYLSGVRTIVFLETWNLLIGGGYLSGILDQFQAISLFIYLNVLISRVYWKSWYSPNNWRRLLLVSHLVGIVGFLFYALTY